MNQEIPLPLVQPSAQSPTQSPARIVAQILVDCVLRSHFAHPTRDQPHEKPKNPPKALDFRSKRSVNCPEYRLQSPPYGGETGRST
jgi:hypothetical protein